MLLRMARTRVKGYELKLYETPLVIVGLLFNFATVNMRGPNKCYSIVTDE